MVSTPIDQWWLLTLSILVLVWCKITALEYLALLSNRIKPSKGYLHLVILYFSSLLNSLKGILAPSMLCRSKLFYWKGLLKLSTFLLILFAHTSNFSALQQPKSFYTPTITLSTWRLEPTHPPQLSSSLVISALTLSATLSFFLRKKIRTLWIWENYLKALGEYCWQGPLARITGEN